MQDRIQLDTFPNLWPNPSVATNPAMTTGCHTERHLRRFVDRKR